MNIRHGLLLVLIGLAAGCATSNPLSGEMAGWRGNHVSAALGAWGEPEERRAFGDETVLIWRDRASSASPSGRIARPARAAVLCERMLAVADDGTVTGWRWRGDACATMRAGDRAETLRASR